MYRMMAQRANRRDVLSDMAIAALVVAVQGWLALAVAACIYLSAWHL